MRVFFIVIARDSLGLEEKIRELTLLGHPYLVVCGERVDLPNVVYREPRGKFDALNHGLKLVPLEAEIVAFNDVDTEIHNLHAALSLFNDESVSLVFVKVKVAQGPQSAFYSFLDPVRNLIPVAASGELMMLRRQLLSRISPLKACKAEDSYILFKTLEQGGKAVFSQESFVTTRRTSHASQEEEYKRRTVGGIYQALSLTRPPATVRLFYLFLPILAPLFLITGKKGFYWTKGVLLGFTDYVRGDRTAAWSRKY